MNREITKRVDYLDSLRSLAIVLVCLGHVLGYLKTLWNPEIDDDVYNNMYKFIYFFHMPLFFMLSGITYEKFSRRGDFHSLKNTMRKRVTNLIVPVIFMVSMSLLIHGKKWTVFDYYQCGWFLVFLALFILINCLMDYVSMKNRNIEKLVFTLGFLAWLIIGLLQLFLLRLDKLHLAKFACEISKFFGYLICFLLARHMCKHNKIGEEGAKLDSKFYIVLVLSVVTITVGFLLQADPNAALVKIICGVPISIVLLMLFGKYKKNCSRIEKIISNYSLEIYLVHLNIIHGIFLPEFPFYITNQLEVLLFILTLLLVDVAMSVLVGYLENFIRPLKFVFHPIK